MSRSILKQLIAKRSMHRFHAGANGKPLPSKFLAQLAAGLGLTGVIALGGTSPVFAQTMIEDVPAGGITFGSTTNLCNNFLVRSFNVNDNISVGDVSLGLNISHGFRGAIRGFLQAPSSNFIEFLNINGGDTNDNYDVLFQDGGGAINDGGIDDVGSPFYDRTVNPNQALSTFAGESAFGTWNLFLCDGGSGIQGTYNRSLLTIFPPDISGFAFDDVNRDNTRGASEGVLSNVGLTAYRDDGDGAFEPGADDVLVATSQTGSTGAYAFNGLTNGDYWIDVDETDSDLAGRSYGGSAATGTADPRLVPFSGAAIGDIDFPFFQDLQFLCDPGDPTGQLAFLDGAVLESGSDLQVGAVYRFADVFANTDALVEVAAFNGGATLAAIDNDSTGVSSAFQPTLNAASGTTSSVDFNITFVVKDTNTPVTITFKAAGVDIDGDGGSLREFIELTNLSSFSLATPTTLTATAITSGNRFESNTVVAQPGVSATATQTLATTQYTSVSQFRYRIGAIDGGASSATQRLNSLYFGCTNGPVTSANLEDYGDAPDTYGTDATAGNSGGDPVGASHTIVSGIHLGSTAPDDETDASTPLDGSGDGAEDDGINLPTLTEGDTSYTIPAGNITATGTGVLHAWLDFDQSGTFESGEYSSVSVTSGTLAGDLTWNSITAGGAGDTYARFRFTSDASINANTPGGAASDGEVEDYQVAISSSPISSQPFICDTSLYIVIGSSNGVPFSQLNYINRSTNPFTFEPIGNQVNTYNYNALAYNPVDNYLYAIVEEANASSPFPAGAILRIGSDGVPVSLGQPQGDALSYNPNAGAFLANGTYVVTRQSNPIYTIDVTTTPPTATLQGIVTGARFEDIAINPYDPTPNRVYGIDDNSDQLVHFDVTNPGAGVTQAISGGNTTLNHNHGSQFYDVFGNLLYRSASNNALYIINSDGTATFLANTPSGGSHDGASCFAVGLTKEVNTTDPAPAGQTVTYTYKIGNSSDVPMTVTLTDDLRSVTDYLGSTENESAAPVNGSYTGVINTPSGTVALSNSNQTLTISGISVAPQSITTLTAEVTVPLSATPDTYYNQASLSGLPPTFVSTVDSDYPATALFQDPTPVQVTEPLASDPNVLLVKRITLLNGDFSTTNGDDLAAYIDEVANDYDDNTLTPNLDPEDTNRWPDPATFLIGGVDGGDVRPDDEIEYTIYFLSTGDTTANNVLVCDRVPDFVDFLPAPFNVNPTADINGNPTGDRGIVLGLGTGGSAIAESSLTNEADGDIGYYFPPGEDPTTTFPNINCGGANDNGAVVVNLGDLPNAASAGEPAGSYGFVRFRARVR